MTKKIKRLIGVLLIAVMAITNFSTIAKAEINDYGVLNNIQSNYNINIDQSSLIPLHNGDDSVIAYFYCLNPTGYIILDSNTYGIIEFSGKNNRFITDQSKTYYYSGPLRYFEGSTTSDYIKDIKKDKLIQKNTINFESKTSFENERPIYTRSIAQGELVNDTRLFDTNTNDNCGSTAAAILFTYYREHLNKNYVKDAYFTADGRALTDLLITHIEPNGGGSTAPKLKSGMNSYLKSISLAQNVDYVTVYNAFTRPQDKMEAYIDSGRPCIIGTWEDPKYEAHWAVAIAYIRTSTTVAFMTVNDGWGDDEGKVNYAYLDTTVFIK